MLKRFCLIKFFLLLPMMLFAESSQDEEAYIQNIIDGNDSQENESLSEILHTMKPWVRRILFKAAYLNDDSNDKEVLEKLTNLEKLNLDSNDLGPEGAWNLAPALEKLTNLKNLSLSWDNLGPDGARYLAPALEKLTSLTR